MTEVDGRRLRAERSRERVLEAVLDLVDEGESRPTAQQVADRSGVSIRSVFRLYDDVHELHAAAIATQARRVQHLYELPAGAGRLEARVTRLVAARAKLFETIAPVRRLAVRMANTSPEIRGQLTELGDMMRGQLDEYFAAELGDLPPARHRLELQALDVVLSWESWERLRVGQGLTERAAKGVVTALVTALLAPDRS